MEGFQSIFLAILMLSSILNHYVSPKPLKLLPHYIYRIDRK